MDSTENGSVILIEMVLLRRIFILVSGARNIEYIYEIDYKVLEL